MHFIIFTEEPSAEAALQIILPKLIDTSIHTFQILVHNGKEDLLKKLPGKLRGMQNMVQQGWRFLILIDRDNNDCHDLKQKLEKIATQSGLFTKNAPDSNGQFQVVNRILIEELESWFIGDARAIATAYPKVNINTLQHQRFANPDLLQGGTYEILERILQRAGYFQAGLAKIEAAREISNHMNVLENRSPSFNCFIQGIQSFC